MHVQEEKTRGIFMFFKKTNQFQIHKQEGPSRPLDPLRKMRLYRPPTSPGRLTNNEILPFMQSSFLLKRFFSYILVSSALILGNCVYVQRLSSDFVNLQNIQNCHWDQKIQSLFDTSSYSVSFGHCDGYWKYNLVSNAREDSFPQTEYRKYHFRMIKGSGSGFECFDLTESDRSKIKVIDASIVEITSYKPIIGKSGSLIWELLLKVKKDGVTEFVINDSKKNIEFHIPAISRNGSIKDTSCNLKKETVKKGFGLFWIPVHNDSLKASP
jgi:hypothetical protein